MPTKLPRLPFLTLTLTIWLASYFLGAFLPQLYLGMPSSAYLMAYLAMLLLPVLLLALRYRDCGVAPWWALVAFIPYSYLPLCVLLAVFPSERVSKLTH